MNTARYVCSTIRRALLSTALFAASAFALQASSADTSRSSVLRSAPLGLPRLANDAELLGHKHVSPGSYESLELSASTRAKHNKHNGSSYLEIEPGGEWNQKLRSRPSSTRYVSFSINASFGTVIDVDGANLLISSSSRDTKYASLIAGTDVEDIDHEMPWMLYGGIRLAPLDMVTLKIDRKQGTWSMWVRDTLVASEMTLFTPAAPGKIRVTGGKAGAWIIGVICSDENPLFEDENNNSVPDNYEISLLGALLPDGADAITHMALQSAWALDRRILPPQEYVSMGPLPDEPPEDCSPQGEIVHGMQGGLKFGTKTQ